MIISLHFPQSIVCYIKKAVAEFKTVEKLCSFITAVGKMIRIHNYLVNVNHNPFLYYRIVVGMSSIFGSPRMGGAWKYLTGGYGVWYDAGADKENNVPWYALIPNSIRALICCHSPATRYAQTAARWQQLAQISLTESLQHLGTLFSYPSSCTYYHSLFCRSFQILPIHPETVSCAI